MTALLGSTAAAAGAPANEDVRQAIGFVLLTHAKPQQTLRLVERLNELFGAPPIAIHHDFGKCALDMALFPKNVQFLQPHVTTGWGDFSLVEATLRGLSVLHAGGKGPEWTVVLSGACYPIKPAAQILRDLQAGNYDAHIGFACVDKDALPPDTNTLDRRRLHVYHDRYCVPRLRILSVTKRLRPITRRLAVRRPDWLRRRLVPFSPALRCYAGSQWLNLNRRAVEYVLAYHAAHPTLAAFYAGTEMADESYFQTILANGPLKLNDNHWRYMDWSEWGPHPKALTVADVPLIAASPAHFARKVGQDVRLLEALDALCAVPAESLA